MRRAALALILLAVVTPAPAAGTPPPRHVERSYDWQPLAPVPGATERVVPIETTAPIRTPAASIRAKGERNAPRPPETARGAAKLAGRVSVGWASWYGGSRGFAGVPHVAVPAGRWTGRIGGHVAVCVFAGGRTRCGTFPVVDCLCGRIPGRVVDLSIEAVRALDLNPATGVWRATVEAVQ